MLRGVAGKVGKAGCPSCIVYAVGGGKTSAERDTEVKDRILRRILRASESGQHGHSSKANRNSELHGFSCSCRRLRPTFPGATLRSRGHHFSQRIPSVASPMDVCGRECGRRWTFPDVDVAGILGRDNDVRKRLHSEPKWVRLVLWTTWHWIGGSARVLACHAIRASMASSSSGYAAAWSTAVRSVRLLPRKKKTVATSPPPQPPAKPVIARACAAAPNVRRELRRGRAPRTRWHARCASSAKVGWKKAAWNCWPSD